MDLQEKIDIVRCYFCSGESPTAALRQYKKEKQLKDDPFSVRTIQRIVDRFLRTGSVGDKPRSGRPSISGDTIDHVQQSVKEIAAKHHFGHASTSQISKSTNIPKSTVHKVLRCKLQVYPYRLMRVQKISDPDKRLEFAQWFLANLDMLENILWTDEANFYTNGHINTHNCVIWGSSKPNQVIEQQLHSPRVTVWMGFSAKLRLEPYFFESTVDGTAYLDMLQNHLRPQLASKRRISSTVFMQDGAPPHIKQEVKDFLKSTFSENRIISRGFPQFWPPYSPDLNPLDYFFWGHVRDKVYAQGNSDSLVQLKSRISAAINEINQETFRHSVYNLIDRCPMVVEDS